MSNKGTKKTEETQEKIVTKYDLKMKRREEQKAKEKREKQFGTVLGILIVAALVCFVASFPIRTYATVNGTYVTVGGEKVNRVEFDYNYNIVSNNFIAQYGYMYYYYMGIDLSGDLSTQMYTADLTWKDFFDEMTVDNIARNKALEREAKAAGFTYDTTDEYAEYMDSLEQYASESGATMKQYIKQVYGVYATEARVKPFIQQAMYVSAYYNSAVDELIPSRDEIQQYYEENKDNFDSVDYRIFSVDAQLPTEPTELADPTETAAPDGSASGEPSASEQTAYQPSEAEIAAAMEAAKSNADKLLLTIQTAGSRMVNVRRSDAVYLLRDWLFAADRVAGDTTVIEDTTNNRYYVLAFEQRYLDNTKAADIRMIRTTGDMGQTILDEWKSGAATEESFAELYEKYKDPDMDSTSGGLYEALASSSVPDEVKSWVFSDQRVSGETAVISPASSQYTFVIYYIAPNQEEWALEIQDTLQSERISDYIDELIDSVEVEDKKGNLHYLEVYAQQQQEEEQEEQK